MNKKEDKNTPAEIQETGSLLKELGVINGKTKTEFAPNDNVTREEFVKMIILLADINVEHGEFAFDDVVEGEWYYTPIKAAFQKKDYKRNI